MSLYGAIADGRRIRLGNTAPASGASGQPLVLDVQDVTFTGTGSVVFPELVKVLGAEVTMKGSAAPGLGTSDVTYTVDGTTANKVDLFGWMPTSSANPTLIASTSSVSVTVVALGVRRQGQSV